ncbi:MAG: hypothetical protein LBG70_02800, partial [Bifidobacteriaceae bacterium]|nr:hypothetical protein [Bifidobacteriaceae bacterium]
MTTVVLVMLVAAHASYVGRQVRDAARCPVFVEVGDSSQVAWFHWRTEESALVPVEVMAFDVTDPVAPPPVGIDRWPEAGEVFVSAALANMTGSDNFVARYGRLAGMIAVNALADPGERLAYVGRVGMSADRAYPIAGFGQSRTSSDTGYFGTALYQQREMNILVGILVFGLIPGLLLYASTIKLDIERRQARLTVLRSLGATPGQVRRVVLAQVLPPVLWGAGTATVLSGLASLTTWRLPGLHFYLVGGDLRPWLWLVPLAASLATVIGCGMAMFTHRQRLNSVNTPRPHPQVKAAARWPAGGVICLIIAANALYYQLFRSDPALAALLALICAGATLAFISGVTALALRVVANR